MLLQELLPGLAIRILSLDRLRPGTWWNYRGVNNTYNRLYLIHDGEAFVRHNGRTYRMTQGSIAFELGFTSPQYFARVFKSHVGVTPSKYRELQTRGNAVG